ncbi:uncharacterized protein PG986_005630 [Apiospora aurea]|uniref:AAA+ ATPase domain-containing protein n=1 Tax=Apiospora aurea TaxID=335848 RepID=A0ABR1QI49_9PEZI
MATQSTSDKEGDRQAQITVAADTTPRKKDGAEARATPLSATDARRVLTKSLVNVVLQVDSLLKAVIGTQELVVAQPAAPETSSQNAPPVSLSESQDTSNTLTPSSQPVARDPSPSGAQESPEISRTVVAQRGNVLNGEKRYYTLSEGDYDGVETHNTESAFEMRKDVATIKPPSNDRHLMQLGNSALDNDIVDHVTSEKIVIRSPHLLKVVKENIYWPSSAFYDGQKSLTLDSPYRSVGVYRDTLGQVLDRMKGRLSREETVAKAADEFPDSDLSDSDLRLTAHHLELFLCEVDKVQWHGIQLEKERHNRKKATFDMLWKLYKPGMVVYTEKDGVKLACRVKLLIWSHGSVIKAGPDDPYQRIEVVLWYLDHDGRYINRRSQAVSIHRYHGEKSILELPVYPETFMTDWQNERRKRIERGQRFMRLITKGHSYCDYNGAVSIDAENPYNTQKHQAYAGKVIVDPEQHYRESGSSKGTHWLDEGDVRENAVGAELRQFIKLNPTEPTNNNSADAIPPSFGEDQLFLLPEWIRGFTMSTHGNRKWVWLHVDHVNTYEPDRDLVNTIALDDKDIQLLKAMTHFPEQDDNLWSPERIESKGKGRAIILHGPPGLGKTYTAECIAAWSGRPLLRLTCAELGVDPGKLEVQLSAYLNRAERWKAIVLMDEADVYMTNRLEHNDSKEIGIVSVFLRALEYFSGIIFLTTNRIRVIDSAIINRAILIMEYKPLTPGKIEKIIKNCTRRFKGDQGSVMDLDPEAKTLLKSSLTQVPSEYEWDGREIVQVLAVAVRLACFGHGDSKTAATKTMVKSDHIAEAIRIIQGHSVYKDRNGASKKGASKK